MRNGLTLTPSEAGRLTPRCWITIARVWQACSAGERPDPAFRGSVVPHQLSVERLYLPERMTPTIDLEASRDWVKVMMTRRAAAVFLLGALALAMAACGTTFKSSTPTTTAVPASTTTTTTATTTTTEVGAQGTPDAAIGAWMAAKGHRYVGECAKATMSQGAGSQCSTLRADRAEVKIFEAGPTFSEYTTWLLVRHTASGWAVVDSAARGTAPGVSNQPPW